MALRIVTKFGLPAILDIKDDLEEAPDPTWASSADKSFIFHSLDLMNTFQHFPAAASTKCDPTGKSEISNSGTSDQPIVGLQQSILQITLSVLLTKCLEKVGYFQEGHDEKTVMFIAKEI